MFVSISCDFDVSFSRKKLFQPLESLFSATYLFTGDNAASIYSFSISAYMKIFNNRLFDHLKSLDN